MKFKIQTFHLHLHHIHSYKVLELFSILILINNFQNMELQELEVLVN